MARFRLSRLAEADLARILETSAEQWGAEGRRRYAALVAVAVRKVATDPQGPLTRDRDELQAGVRAFHLRHARFGDLAASVRRPVHVLYFRIARPNLIEILRVLHERMEPSSRLSAVLRGRR